MLVKTLCPYCGVGCSIFLKVKNNSVTRCVADNKDPVSEGKPCLKGMTSHETIYAGDRIKNPMIKKNGKLVDASWDEAYKFIHENTKKLGPDEISFYASSPATNEDAYIFQKFAREVFKTKNIDSCARLCHATTCYALRKSFGISAMPHSMLKDLRHADCILILGSNPRSNYPVAFNKMLEAQKSGAKIICVKQVADETVKSADIYVEVYDGSQLPFLNAVLKILVERKSVKVSAELKEVLKNYPTKRVAKVCGVKEKEIELVADHVQKSKNLCVAYGMSLTQHTYGVQNVLAAANLVIAKNGKIVPMRGKSNIQGVGDVGCLPRKGGDTLIGSVFLYPVKSLWIMESNPAQSMPDLNKVHKALKKMFVILHTTYPNLTMKFADVVLPCCSWAERSGTFTSAESRIRMVKKAIKPLHNSKPNWKIIIEAAETFGKKYSYKNVFDILKEIKKKTVGYKKISLAKVKNGESQFIERKIRFKKFYPTEFKGFEEHLSKKYPHILTTARKPHQFCTGEMSSRSKTLNKLLPEPRCYISIEDAKKLKLKNEDLVIVSSRVGKIKIKVKITKGIPPKLVIIPYHFETALVNKLVPLAFSIEVEEPNLKRIAVNITKISK